MRQPPVRQTDHIPITDQTVTAIDDRYSQPHHSLLDRSLHPRPAPRADPHATSRSPDPQGRLTENLLAVMPPQPPAYGHRVVQNHLRAARRRRRGRCLGPSHRPDRRQLPQSGPAHGQRQDGGPRVRELPQGPLAEIWSTNPLERINKEIKRRSRVVGIFPNETSAIRLVGAILADLHDEWQATERRYLS